MRWEILTEYDSKYEASDFGFVREISTGKHLKHYPYKVSGGGIRLKVFINTNKGSYRLVDLAKLVARHFAEDYDKSKVLDFKDGNPLNCVATNLYFRDADNTKGYFRTEYGNVTDDEYISRAIKEYRKRYPNDYYLTDEDLEQELKLKMFTNREKGISRTTHFDIYLKTIHNMNRDKNMEGVEALDFDDFEDRMTNDYIESEIDRIDNYGWLADKLKYYIENTLTSRECNVLKFRYGMFPDNTYDNLSTIIYSDKAVCSLEDAGKYFGVSRERIRQVEAKAMRKLRHPSRLGRYVN